MMSFDPVKIVNADTLEKLVLTRQIGDFLSKSKDEVKRAAIENVARALAQDIAKQVREALAFELRTCAYLPYDLAARIASDIESVSGPFLASTTVFSDADLAGLIPHLEEHAHITLAKRKDLGQATCEALVSFGSEAVLGYLVRNLELELTEKSMLGVIRRFPDRTPLMDALSERPALPIAVVEKLINKVSDRFRALLQGLYDISSDVADAVVRSSMTTVCMQVVANAKPHQIHAYVKDLRAQNRLSMDLILDMAERGCMPFLESALAFRSGFTLAAVKDMLQPDDMTMFVHLMKKSDVDRASAEMILQLLKKQYGQN